jgi:hypothetical protein
MVQVKGTLQIRPYELNQTMGRVEQEARYAGLNC